MLAAAILIPYFIAVNHIILICFIILGIICIVNGLRNNNEYTCKGCNYKFKTINRN